MYRGLGSIVRPEVEKPTGKNTVGRPLVLAALLLVIDFVFVYLTMVWLVMFGRLTAAWIIGPVVSAGVFIYAVRAVTLWPPRIEFHNRAIQRRGIVGALLATAALCAIVYIAGFWPDRYPGGKLLFIAWQVLPRETLGGGLWVGWFGNALEPAIDAMRLVWLRLAVLVSLPFSLSYVFRILRYRFKIETVYPSWADGAIPRGLRWLDPLGLLDIRLPSETEPPAPIIPAARGDGDGPI